MTDVVHPGFFEFIYSTFSLQPSTRFYSSLIPHQSFDHPSSEKHIVNSLWTGYIYYRISLNLEAEYTGYERHHAENSKRNYFGLSRD